LLDSTGNPDGRLGYGAALCMRRHRDHEPRNPANHAAEVSKMRITKPRKVENTKPDPKSFLSCFPHFVLS